MKHIDYLNVSDIGSHQIQSFYFTDEELEQLNAHLQEAWT